MHKMSCLSLAWHRHVVCGHLHLRGHYGIVGYGELLLSLLALVNVKNWVFLLA